MTISFPNIYNLEDSFVCGEIVCYNHVLKWGTHDNESFQEIRFYKTTDSMQTVTSHQLGPTPNNGIVARSRTAESCNASPHASQPTPHTRRHRRTRVNTTFATNKISVNLVITPQLITLKTQLNICTSSQRKELRLKIESSNTMQ